jgi:hypothetical protein
MSSRQTRSTTGRHFLKTISLQYPVVYVTARVFSMVPILVDVDAFALPSRPPSINGALRLLQRSPIAFQFF